MKESEKGRGSLSEVFFLFLKLGIIGFGGPAAHIAMMEEEVVSKRKWMSRQHFLDLMGATNLIPGPNSTEMTMHCGKERAGWPGLFVAGGAFILPAVLLTLALAVLYVEYGQVPEIAPLLTGIKPAVLAIIAAAIIKLGKKALKSTTLGVIGALVFIAAFVGLTEVLAILLGGVLALLWTGIRGKEALALMPLIAASIPQVQQQITQVSTSRLFLVFLKVGSILFGSGYVLVAYLQGELVDKLGWLTQGELLDAIAIGQFTPGPVLSTATFVGYQVDGYAGALAATLGIFLPSFFFVLLLHPLVPKLRASRWAGAFLDGVNIGAVAIMLAVTIDLAIDTLIDWRAMLILALALFFTFGPRKLGPVWQVLMGMVLGYALQVIP
jgi:chromate transporter